MADATIYAELTEIFQEVFMRDDIALRADLTASDVDGWDSFKQIEIIIAVEEKYHFKFGTKELDQLRNVGDLAAAIARHAGVAR